VSPARLPSWWNARARWLPFLAHLLPPLYLFAGPLFGGRVLYFRDLTYYYFPNYVFLERSLRQGLWPLWNPSSDSGAPFLMAYPLDLALVALLGARRAMALDAPLHLLVAMCGVTLLVRTLGGRPWGAWAAGLFYGVSGFLLSAVNLSELFHAACWAPWVIAAWLRAVGQPSAGRLAALGALAAVQLSTLSGELLLQTAVAGLLLTASLPAARTLARLAAAGVVAVAAAAPALLGVWTLVQGTRRAQGISRESAFAWSAPGPVLLEALVPRLFGDVHSFSETSYWGQPFFPSGQPYLLSLYLGMGVLVLAAVGAPGRRRWWCLLALGILLAMGWHGPLAWLLAPLMTVFRGPVKFTFLATLALCVLAGFGVDRARDGGTRRYLWALVPGAALMATGAWFGWGGAAPLDALAGVVPASAADRARSIAAKTWPAAFLLSGALAAGGGLVLAVAPRFAAAAALLAGLDLLAVNAALNPTADRSFYELQPAMRAVVESAAAKGPYRWFSYGLAHSPALRWLPAVVDQDLDVWLYYGDRQSLLPRTPALDGLESAFDEDRVAWAPPGATLETWEKRPDHYAMHHLRLRLANVRWVVAFHDLPPHLVQLYGTAPTPGLVDPVRVYEVRDPLPRAYWVPRAEVVEPRALDGRLGGAGHDPRAVVLVPGPLPPFSPGASPAAGHVTFERRDPETVRLRSSGGPGWLVVREGYHRNWRARGAAGDVPLLRADGRYWALPTPGGEQEITVRYQPGWRVPALAASALGLLAALAAALLARRAPADG
jgi:hypothetical protein